MDRRNALRNLGILTGGMVLLPSCDFSQEKVSLVLNKLSIKASEESLMKELVSCIIPEGDMPGAASLKVDGFVWVMVDDCLNDKDQSRFLKGLHSFEATVKKSNGKSFLSMEQDERETTLTEILNKTSKTTESAEDEIKFFVSMTKNLTAYGYMKSEYIMKEVMPYTLIPGSYGPCETVDYSKRINVNG